jgi:plastocyanin
MTHHWPSLPRRSTRKERSHLDNAWHRRGRCLSLWLVILALFLPLVLVACDGTTSAATRVSLPTAVTTDTPSPAPTATASPTAIATATPVPTHRPRPTSTPTRPAPTPTFTPAPRTVDISISGYAFAPNALTIRVGDTARWTNMDPIAHTATSTAGPETFDTGQLAQHATGSHTFMHAGSYAYHCLNHPFMTATITVTA